MPTKRWKKRHNNKKGYAKRKQDGDLETVVKIKTPECVEPYAPLRSVEPTAGHLCVESFTPQRNLCVEPPAPLLCVEPLAPLVRVESITPQNSFCVEPIAPLITLISVEPIAPLVCVESNTPQNNFCVEPSAPLICVEPVAPLPSVESNTPQNNFRVEILWLRHRDLHLLTTGVHTYSRDKRFSAVHRFPGNDWVLRIQQTRINDSGIYQCQVATTPPVGITFHLSVVEPITSIIGEPDIFISKGSNLNITCIIKNWPIMDNPQNPSENQQVLWDHRTKPINYDSPRGGVSVVTEKSNKYSSSSLLIINASAEDSGRYTCKPDLANQTSVFVHVLAGEIPAAMKNDAKLKLGLSNAINTTPKADMNDHSRGRSLKFSFSIFLLTLAKTYFV